MASISVSEMRIAVSRVYNGRKWKIKVENMDDRQVMALYYRFYHGEKKAEKPKKSNPSNPTFNAYTGEQMRFEGM